MSVAAKQANGSARTAQQRAWKANEVTPKVGCPDEAGSLNVRIPKDADQRDQFILQRMPTPLRKWRWPLEEVERHVNDKIVQHTRRATDQMRSAFTLFDSVNKGITKEVFRKQLNRKFGVVLTDDELDVLFRRYDTAGNNAIDFHEFLSGILQRDYTRRPWYVQRGELQRGSVRRAGGKRVDPARLKNFTSANHPLAASEPGHTKWHREHPNRRAFDQLREIGDTSSGAAEGNDSEADILGQPYDMSGLWRDPAPVGNAMGVRGKRMGLDATQRPRSRQQLAAQRRARARAAGNFACGPGGVDDPKIAAQTLLHPRREEPPQGGEADATAGFASTGLTVEGVSPATLAKGSGPKSAGHAPPPMGERHWRRAAQVYEQGAPGQITGPEESGWERVAAGEVVARSDYSVPPQLPPSLAQWRWPIDKVKDKIAQKMFNHTSRAADQLRQAFWIFGHENRGVPKSTFKDRLCKRFGIVLTDEEVDLLFRGCDTSEGGRIDFYSFVRAVLPTDYAGEQWSDKRGRAMQEERHKKKLQGNDPAGLYVFDARCAILQLHFVTALPPSLEKWRWTVEKTENKIRDKIIQHTRAGGSTFQQMFELFDRVNKGVTKDKFCAVMRTKLGVLLTQAEVDAIFEKYDRAREGRLNFYDFVSGVMPQDYPAVPRHDRFFRRADGTVPHEWQFQMTSPDIPGLSESSAAAKSSPALASGGRRPPDTPSRGTAGPATGTRRSSRKSSRLPPPTPMRSHTRAGGASRNHGATVTYEADRAPRPDTRARAQQLKASLADSISKQEAAGKEIASLRRKLESRRRSRSSRPSE